MMKLGKGMRKLFPGTVALNVLVMALGLLLAFITLMPELGMTSISSFFVGLGSAMFLAGFLGLLYTTILVEEFRRLTDQPFEQMAFLSKIQHTGLSDIFRNRTHAVETMLESLADENKQFILVGSSLKGLIGVAFDEEDEYSNVWKGINEALQRKVKINILLTNPEFAHHRALQEGRNDGEIEAEILENLIYLVQYKMENPALAPYLTVKLFNGTPTMFFMCTSRKMLINPYPYFGAGYNSFCFLFDGGSPLYTSYYQSHYRSAWLDSNAVIEIKDDPKEAIKQLQELINMTGHDKTSLLIPNETKRNAMLQTLFGMLQNK